MWDHFSIYLTIKDQHLREIEALLLRISKPPGAKQSGKLAQSKDMKRQIMRAIKSKFNRETSSLFDSFVDESDGGIKARAETELTRLFPTGARIRATNKDQIFRAVIRRDGRVRFKGKFYSSLSLAAKAAIKRSTNGWWFWQIERGKGNWVRLDKSSKSRDARIQSVTRQRIFEVDVTNPEAIYEFLTSRTPASYCDDCVARNTSIGPRQQVNPICAALGLTSDFDRQQGVCQDCRGTKLVTRSLRHAKG